MNKFIGVGRLGYDPDVIAGGCKIKMAFDTWDGSKKKAVWIKVLVFGPASQNCLNHKRKGDRLLIEGRIDMDAKNEFCIITDNLTFL